MKGSLRSPPFLPPLFPLFRHLSSPGSLGLGQAIDVECGLWTIPTSPSPGRCTKIRRQMVRGRFSETQCIASNFTSA
eukprot:scaffold10983_cov36-Cyclotella_meneghiniana.AAC.1